MEQKNLSQRRGISSSRTVTERINSTRFNGKWRFSREKQLTFTTFDSSLDGFRTIPMEPRVAHPLIVSEKRNSSFAERRRFGASDWLLSSLFQLIFVRLHFWSSARTMTTAICSYENIRQITSCTVCNRTFKDPRILPCGHTFCIDCIRNTMLESTLMSCPNCFVVFIARPLHLWFFLRSRETHHRQCRSVISECRSDATVAHSKDRNRTEQAMCHLQCSTVDHLVCALFSTGVCHLLGSASTGSDRGDQSRNDGDRTHEWRTESDLESNLQRLSRSMRRNISTDQ